MHAALRLPELVLVIVAAVGDFERHATRHARGFKPSIRARTLAALARTCVAFYEPATNLLWYKLTDLSRLAFCMPSDIVDGLKYPDSAVLRRMVSHAVLNWPSGDLIKWIV